MRAPRVDLGGGGPSRPLTGPPTRGLRDAREARRRGLTLVEVLVALVVLSVAMGAWTRLQAHVTRIEAGNRVRRAQAAWMRSELRLQRSLRAFTCRARPAPSGWTCSVERGCLDDAVACRLERVRITIVPPRGKALTATTAVWWPLERAPLERGP